MEHQEMIITPHHGVIEKIYVEEGSRVYEWESLFIIRKHDGEPERIRVGYCGQIASLEVAVGDEVVPGMVLAFLNEDSAISRSD